MQRFFWLLGDPERAQEYTHHMLLLVGSMFYLFFALFNMLFLTTELEFNILLLMVAALQIVIFYFSRFKGKFFVMSVLFVATANLVLLPANWFYNGGSQGPTLLLYLISTFYFNFLLADYPKSRYFFMGVVLAVPAVLVFTEPRFQDWVYAYPSEDAKQLDLWVSYAATTAISVFIMKMYAKRFRLEREKSERLAQKLKVLAETDSLTLLYNRNAFSRLYNDIENKGACSLALLDLDHFKLLNDTYGHQYGDKALVAFAHQLEQMNERGDMIISRHGGEEFLVLFQCSMQDAFAMLETFKNSLDVRDPQAKRVTFSGGLVALHSNEALASATHRADMQLYRAKTTGRNQVCSEA